MSNSKPIKPQPNYYISDRAFEVLNHGISGALAGCISTFLLYPIENVKTRMQAMAKANQQHQTIEEGATTGTVNLEKKEKKPTVTDTVKEIIRKEGIKGFYKAIVPYVIGTLASFGIYFFWYEFFKGIFSKQEFNAWQVMKTGLVAGCITTTFTNPIWVVQTRILLEKSNKLNLWEAIKSIVHNEGIGGFFKGLGASYVLVLNPIVQFVVYEFLKNKFAGTKYTTALIFIAGAISKAIATIVTYPYQTIKTLLQANKGKHVNQIDMILEVYAQKGMQGFYNGLSAKLSQTVINSALMLVIYEKLQRLVGLLLGHLLKRAL